MSENVRPTRLDREIVLDIYHLSLGFWRKTPAGVDRVDASFAAHFLSVSAANRKGFLCTPLGPRAVPAADGRRVVEGVQCHWRETERPEEDRTFRRVRNALVERSCSFPRRLRKTTISGGF